MNTDTVKKCIVVTLIMATALLKPSFCLADGPEVNSAAPYFKVVSGSGDELTLDDIKGKVAVIFYETKDVIEKNRRLKNALNEFYESQPDSAKKILLRIPVINCAGAFFLFAGIWKDNLKEHSKIEGMTIYGDWDGKMFSAYKFKDNESNLLIIDKNGIIKYYSAGKAEDKNFKAITNLLAILVNEKPKRQS